MKELGVLKNGSPRSWATSDRLTRVESAGLKTYSVPLGEPIMLYLGIDQHAKQITISLRNAQGDVILKRQVSTEPKRCVEFFTKLKETAGQAGYIAILEVCGFNDWLLELLPKYGCKQTILIQPTKKPKVKTDRRDAHSLSELLWVNQHRLLAGESVRGVRQVVQADQESTRKQDRQSGGHETSGSDHPQHAGQQAGLLRVPRRDDPAAQEAVGHEEASCLAVSRDDQRTTTTNPKENELTRRFDCDGIHWRRRLLRCAKSYPLRWSAQTHSPGTMRRFSLVALAA